MGGSSSQAVASGNGATRGTLLRVGAIGAALSAAPLAPVVAGATTAPSIDGQPSFVAVIEPLPAAVAEEMTGVSRRPDCPVALGDLRLISMNHWGFDGSVHEGELVVHAAVAGPVTDVFAELFASRFPIERMERIDAYDGDDEASMAANNTSAFNCRQIVGGSGPSIHSWGLAIDINTVQNPYLRDGVVLPPAGADFLDRADVRPGMIVDGDAAVTGFAAIGFDWGGTWSSVIDYQHFEISDPEGFLAEAQWTSTTAVAPCDSVTDEVAPPEPSLGELVDLDTGTIDGTTLNAWLAGPGAAVAGSPCDAAVALADFGSAEAAAVVVSVQPRGDGVVDVAITLSGLLDDSVEAVRYSLAFAPNGDADTYSVAAATWAQRCLPGRGEAPNGGFGTELCV